MLKERSSVKLAISLRRAVNPTENAVVENFNGLPGQLCFDEYWFMSLADAKGKIGDWRKASNKARPQSALDWMTPNEFATQKALKYPLPKNQSTRDL
jgi:putative transposase